MDDAVDRLLAVLRSADRVGMAGPLLLNADGSEQAGGRRKLPKPSLDLARATGAGAASQAPSLPVLRFLAASKSDMSPSHINTRSETITESCPNQINGIVRASECSARGTRRVCTNPR
jgi:hypothetical protein